MTTIKERDKAAEAFAKQFSEALYPDNTFLKCEDAFKGGAEWQAAQLSPVIAKLADEYKKLQERTAKLGWPILDGDEDFDEST